MQIRAAEISDVIRDQIKEYEKQLEVRETGVSRRPLAGTRRSPAGIPECRTRRGASVWPTGSPMGGR